MAHLGLMSTAAKRPLEYLNPETPRQEIIKTENTEAIWNTSRVSETVGYNIAEVKSLEPMRKRRDRKISTYSMKEDHTYAKCRM
ncbi:hypothetical protein GDO81_000267 [Engystomops pustulosus]|uniref:Uncharacterized protein n=1 Tax=Engystomops pustulosus TaxID=76066 RepID=A0AAV7D3G8_ENGPU|nr:hypothetical protein GDO81_000267 [Engystomops pustulosus]